MTQTIRHVDVIGDAFKYLFGTATIKDLHKTTSIAKVLTHNIKLWGMILSFLKTAAKFDFQLKQNKHLIDRLKRIYDRTTILQQEITSLTQTFQRTMKDSMNVMFTYKKFLVTYILLISQRIATLTLLQAQALEYLNDIELLITGNMSPCMLSSTQIRDMFTKPLTDDHSSFFITDPDPTHFYSVQKLFILCIRRLHKSTPLMYSTFCLLSYR